MPTVERLKLRSGMKIILDDELFVVVSADHRSPGKGQAFSVVKIKNFNDGRVVEKTFRGQAHQIEVAEFEQRTCQFLYNDQDGYHFMDLTTYEQFALQEEFLGMQAQFLIAEAEVIVSFWNGNPVGLDLPGKMAFKIVDTVDDVARGNTSTNLTKEATIETGMVINVPPFIKNGESVVVNTETGEYVERAKN